MAAQRLRQRSAQTRRGAANQRWRGRGQVRRAPAFHGPAFRLYASSPNASHAFPLPPHSAGVVQWVTQGLTKVLPQPDGKYKETKDDQEEHTEVSHKFK